MSKFKNSVQNLISRGKDGNPDSPPDEDIEMQPHSSSDTETDSAQPVQRYDTPLGENPDELPTDMNTTRETQTEATSLGSRINGVDVTASTPVPYNEFVASTNPIDNLDPPEHDPTRIRRLIETFKSPLETVMDFDYTVYMGFFRLDKQARIQSTWPHKIGATIVFALAMLEILFAINRTKFYIIDKKGNKTRRFTEMLMIISIGLDRIMFVVGLWMNRTNLCTMFKKFQWPYFVDVFFSPRKWDPMFALRLSSYIWSFIVSISGINVYFAQTLSKFGWDADGLLNIHEENVIDSFQSLRFWAYDSGTYYNQARFLNSTVTLSEVVLGATGIITSTAGYQAESSIHDYFLAAVYTLYLAVKALKIGDVMAGEYEGWTRDQLHAHFFRTFRGYERIFRLAKNLNSLIRPFFPFMVAADLLHLVMAIFFIIEGNWTFFFAFTVNPVKTMVGIYLAMEINSEATKIEEWFVDERTQEVLNFPPNRFNGVLFDFNKTPIGIGTAASFVCDGFLVTFLNTALTYFFLIFQADEEGMIGGIIAAAINATNSTF